MHPSGNRDSSGAVVAAEVRGLSLSRDRGSSGAGSLSPGRGGAGRGEAVRGGDDDGRYYLRKVAIVIQINFIVDNF